MGWVLGLSPSSVRVCGVTYALKPPSMVMYHCVYRGHGCLPNVNPTLDSAGEHVSVAVMLYSFPYTLGPVESHSQNSTEAEQNQQKPGLSKNK